MSKKDFLDILSQSLEGEVDKIILEQSIRYYSEYISSQPDKGEEEILKEIGDPRLIAKTIIESENASNRVESASWNTYDSNSNGNSNDYNSGNSDYRSTSNKNEVFHIKWYQMVAIIFIFLLLFFIIIRVGWMLIRLFFIFLLPIIVVALLMAIFRKR
jgi:uncharacterized membrane protein